MFLSAPTHKLSAKSKLGHSEWERNGDSYDTVNAWNVPVGFDHHHDLFLVSAFLFCYAVSDEDAVSEFFRKLVERLLVG